MNNMKKVIKYIILLGMLMACLGSMSLMAQEIGHSSEAISKEMTSKKEEKKVMYLTFDDGPSEYTNDLLDLLAQHDMKVTFFLLEAEMKRNPEVVKRMVDEGHAVGVHGVSHEKGTFYSGTNGPLKEMEQANETLLSIIGEKTCLARTPYGSYPYLTKAQKQALLNGHYVIWDWNIDSRDWSFRSPEKTFYYTTKMIDQSQNEPKVILFHDMKYVTQTMKLFLNWMEHHNYTSVAITPEVKPVNIGKQPKKSS